MPQPGEEPERRVNIGLTRTQSFNSIQDPGSLGPKKINPVGTHKKELKGPNNGGAKQRSQLLRAIEDNHKDIAEQLLDEDFTSGRELFDENRCHKENPDIRLNSVGRWQRTVLHHIFERIQSAVHEEERTELLRTVPDGLREFLECLILNHPDLLNSEDIDHVRPLDLAASKVKPAVFVIMGLVLSDEQLNQLSTKACVSKSKGRTNERCSTQIPSSLSSHFTKKGTHLPGACLHDTLDVDRLKKWMKEFKERVLSKALNPLRGSSTILHTLLDRDSLTRDGEDVRAAGFQRLIELSPRSAFTAPDNEGCCPLHKAIQLYKEDEIDFNRLYEVIETLVRTSPASIYLSGTDSKSPYSLLQTFNPGAQPSGPTTSQDKLESWQKAERLLKYTCIGDSGDRDKKTTYLYGGVKNAKRTFLDLAFEKVDKDFVLNLANTVNFQFESVLEYVSIRRGPNREKDHNSLQPIDAVTPKDRNPYRGVFELLKEGMPDKDGNIEKVEKIFKVVIDDLVSYPHTDDAIKSALAPFDVEIWDWQKLDISSQVILDAAKGARELTLHSSGNEAVLRSWSCKHGLAELTKLECITVIMYPDLRESKASCQISFDAFKKAILRRKPNLKNKIFVKYFGETDPEKGVDVARIIRDSTGAKQEEWREALGPFSRFIRDVDSDQVEVRIALLDNGVKYQKDGIPIAGGQSYYGEQSTSADFLDYFNGPSEHGTTMASFINDVCPVASLYVARMDDWGRDKYTVASAIKAVRWAKDMGADIISMSWTFGTGDATEDQLTDFKTAINEATGLGIVCFNSLDDKMKPENIQNIHPLSHDAIIRIGSATKWGSKAEHSKASSAHYLFPGQDIAITDEINKVASGSSVATAFAAGLAGLILYTQRLLLASDELSSSERQKLESRSSKAAIWQAFNVLAGKPNETLPKDLYVGLGSHFEKDPEATADEAGGESKVLRKLLSTLMLLG